jgi:transposase-like protein
LLNWAKISPVRGEQTVRRPRRNHSAAFKAKVALEAIRGEQPLAELATKFDVHATQIAQWKAELLKGAEAVFDSGKPPPDKAADLNRLHAKIGQLTLENDFLESALTKAGLLSAKR